MSAEAASRLILLMSASLDGFLARGVGEIDWLSEPGEVADRAGDARHAANLELLGQAGGIVVGRGAYEGLPLWHGLPEPQRFAPVSTTAYPDGAVTHVLAAATEGDN